MSDAAKVFEQCPEFQSPTLEAVANIDRPEHPYPAMVFLEVEDCYAISSDIRAFAAWLNTVADRMDELEATDG